MVVDKPIKVSKETKEKLDADKIYKRETYDDVILRLLNAKEEQNAKRRNKEREAKI